MVRVPAGYAGNLDGEQTAALASIKENLTMFAKERAEAPDANVAPPAPDPDPTAPLTPGTAAEEIAEANKLIASDSDMLRFLRARQWDVAKATKMSTDGIKWRGSVKPWALTPDMFPNALRWSVGGAGWRWAGYTKSGMPIIHVDAENWEPSSYYSPDEYTRYVAYMMEGGVSRMGPGVERLFFISWSAALNMEMMKPAASKCLQILFKVLQDQYPERLGASVICNAPPMFPLFWNFCKGWIDPITSAKIQFAPKNALEVLTKYIDAGVIQENIGGTHETYPPPCRSLPDELAEFTNLNTPPPASDASAIRGATDEIIISGAGSFVGQTTIYAGQTFHVQVQLEECTESVSWTFDEAKKRELAFGYKVEMPAKKDPPSAMPSGGGMLGGYNANPLASMVAAKGKTLLMSKDLEPIDFSSGKASGSVDIQKNWAGGTLKLTFDNSAALLLRSTLDYEVIVDDAGEAC